MELTPGQSQIVADYLATIANSRVWDSTISRSHDVADEKAVHNFINSRGGPGVCFQNWLVLEEQMGTRDFITQMADLLLIFGVSTVSDPSVLDQRSLVRMIIAKCNEQSSSQ